MSHVGIVSICVLATLQVTEGVLAGVCDVQEPILILVLLVDTAHEGGSGWQDFIDEDEDGLLGAELDALADDIDELSNGQVCGDEILLFVDGSDVRLLDLLADDWNAIGILLANAFGFCLALFEGMLVLELGTHNDGCRWSLINA